MEPVMIGFGTVLKLSQFHQSNREYPVYKFLLAFGGGAGANNGKNLTNSPNAKFTKSALLELRAKGANSREVAEATGFDAAYVTQLVAKYRDHGLEAISGNHYGGNHRNMSVEEEAAILAPFKERAEKGELVDN